MHTITQGLSIVFSCERPKGANSRKQAQVTIFIILGLVLLLAIGIAIYTQTLPLAEIEKEKPKIITFPPELEPINAFVNTCTEDLAKTAFQQLGESGGYLDTNGLRYNPFEPTEGDAVPFSPDTELLIPYWHYLKDRNDCTGNCEFATNALPLTGPESIESQVNEFVSTKLQECTNSFKAFQEQGFFVEELDKPRIETHIAKDTVFLDINYPLRITKQDQTTTVNTFRVELPLNFREVYNLASTLTNLQAEHRFLEKDMRQLIDAFSRNNPQLLPPVSEIDIKFGIGTIWVKYEVEQKLRALLASYIPILQVLGTNNHRYLPAPETFQDKELYDALYNRGMIIPLNTTHPDISVTFTYLDWWKPYFDLNCKGQVCQPDSMSSTFGFIFGIQRYYFTYDTSIPVLVEIKTPYTLKGDGYRFQFMLEANLRNNNPLPSTFTPITPFAGQERSMLCDIEKQHAGPIRVEVTNARTHKPVNNALISYTCGKEACPIGSTNKGILDTHYPSCIGGLLSIEKEGHHPIILPLNTKFKETQNINVSLEPYQFMNFEIEKYLLKKGITWEIDLANPAAQEADEETVIILEKNTTFFEEPFSAFGNIKGGMFTKEASYNTDIRLIPGLYHVKIYNFKYAQPPVIIPREKRCVKAGPLNERKCFYVPEKPIVFDKKNPLPTGGAEYDWNVTAEMLDSGKTITFKTIAFGLDILPESRRSIEDLEQLGKINEYSKEVREQLNPSIT